MCWQRQLVSTGWLRNVCLLACCLWGATAIQTQAADRPNVLVILADDLGYSDLGCYGGEIPTPNLDRLASHGVRFTQCYNSARCCPSRASLVTGLYPHQTGIAAMTQSKPDPQRGPAYLGHLNDQCVTFAQVLKTAGYRTAMVGKWHMDLPGPIEHGFDDFYGFVHGYEQDQWKPERYQRLPETKQPELSYAPGEFYATDVFTDYTLEFLRQNRAANPEQPWLIYLAHGAPHFPVQAPAESVAKHVPTYRQGWDVLREQRFAKLQSIGLADDTWTLTERSLVPMDTSEIANGYEGQQNPAWNDLPADRREDLAHRMAVFAAMVTHVDEGVGRIVTELANHGELDNTLILFTSDNGACYEWGPLGFDGPSRKGGTKLHIGDELATMGGPGTYHAYGSGWSNLGNTPFRLYKHFTHEGGVCSPLIAHWPRGITQPNRWVHDPVHLIDVMPTLCEVAQATYPATFAGHDITPVEGISLVTSLAGAPLPARSIYYEHQEARAIRRGDWKAVWSKRMPFEPSWELYNITQDRCETRDLSSQHPDKVRELSEAWLEWARKVNVYPFYKDDRTSDTGPRGKMPAAGDTTPKSTQRSTARSTEGGTAAVNPSLAQRAFTLTCDVTPAVQATDGVIVSHGGDRHGYAVYVQEGQVVFGVRINRQLVEVRGGTVPRAPFALAASLLANGEMQLVVNGQEVGRGNASGLIPVDPVDPQCIGRDEQSRVGSYDDPFPYPGRVTNVQFTAGVATSSPSGDEPAPPFVDPLNRGLRE